jgi:serine/threonine-protein kinase
MVSSQDNMTRSYRIVDVLGKGGFGTVYRATMESGGGFTKDVAIKILNEDMLGSEDVVSRLRDEARMLGMIRHRAIVQVDGLVKLKGRWAVVMEYVKGLSLSQIYHALMENREAQTGPVIPVGVALEIVIEVAAALDVAYSKAGREGKPLHILHRDIKPSNIQLTGAGEAKLLDFGIARANFGAREAETRSVVFGSVPYMAPERLAFEDTHKGDVYSLGGTLYEILVGEALGQAHVNPRKHAEKVEEACARLRTEITDNESLLGLVKRLLAYEPEDRPDARALERTLRELRREFPAPYLRDWAEEHIPPLLERQKPTSDDWTDTVLVEETTGRQVVSQPAAVRSPRSEGSVSTGQSRSSSPIGSFFRAVFWTGAGVSTAAVLAMVLFVAVFLLCTVACCNSSFFQEIMSEGHLDDLDVMHEQLALQPQDDPNVQHVLSSLVKVEEAVNEERATFWFMAGLRELFDGVIADGKITEREAARVGSFVEQLEELP